MAIAKRRKASTAAHRRAATPSDPCCPEAGDLVVLAMANPMFEGGATRGFSRRRSDGTSINSEYIEPYGYVVPRGKCLVITDLSYYSGFSQPLAPGALTKLTLGIVKVSGSGWQQTIMFVASPQFSNNKMIGGNVSLKTGFAVSRGCYLAVTPPVHGDLVSTELFVYGYLKPA
jgi:hypothetical protein